MTAPAQVRAGVYGRQSRNKAKSIDEQITICTADVLDQPGWTVAETYTDGSSASRYARRRRDDWQRILDDISAGKLDVLVLWESSRGDRNLTTWSALLDLCRDKDVKIRITDHARDYDMRKRVDWETLAREGIGNAADSDKISTGVRRGHAGSARAGRPSHGRPPYGYRRTYNPETGELVGQEIDPTAASIVREIITKASKGVAISTIADELNERGVPTIGGAVQWHRTVVRDIALNAAYAGQRVYKGKEYTGTWPALVDEVTFHAARRILTDPQRTTTRPGRYKHLLSYLGLCGVCDGLLCAVGGRYKCWKNSCVHINQDETDRLVTQMIIRRLSRPDQYQKFQKAGEQDDRDVVEARGEAARLRSTLDEWRASAARGQTTPESLAVIEASLLDQIKAATRRAEQAVLPVALRQILEPGADVATRWEELPLPARREVIRDMAVIKVGPASAPGSRVFEPGRLGGSSWIGEAETWGDLAPTTAPSRSRLTP